MSVPSPRRSPGYSGPVPALMTEGLLSEMRSRLIAGLKRYFHAKRMEGLLSSQVRAAAPAGPPPPPQPHPFPAHTAQHSTKCIAALASSACLLRHLTACHTRRACASWSTPATMPPSTRTASWASGSCWGQRSRCAPRSRAAGSAQRGAAHAARVDVSPSPRWVGGVAEDALQVCSLSGACSAEIALQSKHACDPCLPKHCPGLPLTGGRAT